MVSDEAQRWIYYIILMLVVIFVGLYWLMGADIIKIIAGKNPFAVPKIEITQGLGELKEPQCTADGYKTQVGSEGLPLRINYIDDRGEDAEIYPILDFGDNPLLDDSGKSIKCAVDETFKFYNCDPVILSFTLKPEKLQSTRNIGTNTPIQMYFFKKTPAIRDYIIDSHQGLGRTTSNLLLTFTDFYIYNREIRNVITTNQCIQNILAQACEGKNKDQCNIDENCYINSADKCVACPIGSNVDCWDFNELSCQKCKFAVDNCAWQPVYKGVIKQCIRR